MEVWKISLVFNTHLNEDKKLFISCTKEGGEFKDSPDGKSYVGGNGYFPKLISKDLRLEKTQGVYEIEKGFTYEPNESELLKLKEEMIKIIIDRIEMEKESYLTMVNYHLKVLNDSLNDKIKITNMFE